MFKDDIGSGQGQSLQTFKLEIFFKRIQDPVAQGGDLKVFFRRRRITPEVLRQTAFGIKDLGSLRRSG